MWCPSHLVFTMSADLRGRQADVSSVSGIVLWWTVTGLFLIDLAYVHRKIYHKAASYTFPGFNRTGNIIPGHGSLKC